MYLRLESCLSACMFNWSLVHEFGLKLSLIELPLGFDFLNWSLKHVILWVLKCFPENKPKRLSFELLNTWFGLGRQIWKFQNLASSLERRIPRSSDHRLFWAPLERRNGGSSVNFKLSESWCTQTHARAREPTLERGLCLTLKRASSRVFQHSVLFAFLQTARARKSTLERPYCFDKLARAKKEIGRASCRERV